MTATRKRNIKIPTDFNTKVRMAALGTGIAAKDVYSDAIAEYAAGTPTPAPPKPDVVNLNVDIDDDTWDAFMERVTAEGLTVSEAICQSVKLPVSA